MLITTIWSIVSLVAFVLHFVNPRKFPPVDASSVPLSGSGGDVGAASVDAGKPAVVKGNPAAGDAGAL